MKRGRVPQTSSCSILKLLCQQFRLYLQMGFSVHTSVSYLTPSDSKQRWGQAARLSERPRFSAWTSDADLTALKPSANCANACTGHCINCIQLAKTISIEWSYIRHIVRIANCIHCTVALEGWHVVCWANPSFRAYIQSSKIPTASSTPSRTGKVREPQPRPVACRKQALDSIVQLRSVREGFCGAERSRMFLQFVACIWLVRSF